MYASRPDADPSICYLQTYPEPAESHSITLTSLISLGVYRNCMLTLLSLHLRKADLLV